MKQTNRIGGFAMLGIAFLLISGSTLGVAADCGRCGADDCCGMGAQAGYGAGKGQGYGAGKAMQGARGNHHETIHALLDEHEAIQRHVEEIEGGVETTTTSEDPQVTKMIRKHVRDMKQRVESGHGMRWWDPTFAELFKHHDEIEMQIEDIEGGVRVRETSANPDVTLLIQQHAIRGVSEFVSEGRARAGKATPLPEDYGKDTVR
jgi:uncharacterized protein YdcH (DUF465 family)